MLHLLLGTDWTANRDEVMKRIAADTDRDFFMSAEEAVRYGLVDRVIDKR